nr:hypothetical protein [uncultured Allomuricauda sp.]
MKEGQLNYILSWIPSVLGSFISAIILTGNQWSTLGISSIIALTVMGLFLPLAVYKYNKIKYLDFKDYREVFHLKGECALANEYSNLFKELSTQNNNDHNPLIKKMTITILSRMKKNYSGDRSLQIIQQRLSESLTSDSDINKLAMAMENAHQSIQSDLLIKLQKAKIYELLYP